MKRDERLYLNDLSTQIFGRSSVWKKFYNKGEISEMTRTLDDGSIQKYKGIKYSTLEEVKARLEVLLKEKQDKEAKKAQETNQGAVTS